MKNLKDQEIEDLLVGAKIMGTGGGGEASWVSPLIDEIRSKGKRFILIDADEMPRSEVAVIVGMIGGGVTKEQAAKVRGLRRMGEPPEFAAFRRLAEHLGKEPYAVFPTELGAGNTLLAMCAAAMLDKPTVDCDCAGRAKPELSISTTNIAGASITPACLVSPFGDTVLLRSVLDDTRAEEILRAITAASGGSCGLSRCPLDGEALARSTIPRTVSWCIEIGRSVRRSSEPVEAVLKATGGTKVFEGDVDSFRRDEHGGFMWGETLMRGSGDYAGRKMKVWYKNEHLLSWLDGRPYVTCPDAICVVDARTGLGLSNWGREFAKGRRVVAFGVRSHKLFRSKKGVSIFGPRHFGYDIEYKPLEERVAERRARA